MLVEMCCKCGFVHKDDRVKIGDISYRAYKPHYHWTPTDGELNKAGVILHSTICVACCGENCHWKEFYEQREKMKDKYKVKFSLNAPLPDRLLDWASDLYKIQSTFFQFD